jgi:thioesterase domain-containing protein
MALSCEQIKKRIDLFQHQVLLGYQPVALPPEVPIVLYKATDRHEIEGEGSNDPFLGWKPYSESKITVHNVPGKHHSIITEPHVRFLADCLNSEMDKY